MRLILYISFFISICHVLFSTTEMCGNGTMSLVQSQIYSDILTKMASRDSESNEADQISRKVPVTFVMATTAEIDLGKLLDDANSAFSDMDISFDPYDTLFVENTQFYHLDNAENGGIAEGKELRKAYHHFYSLNVYIVDTLVGLQGTAPYCGINEDYYGFSNWVILSNHNGGIDRDSEKNNFTFIHELGHHFCLLHTHHGTDQNEDDCVFEGDSLEYVNGFECDLRGDKLCDTPADPNLNQGALVNSAECTYDNTKCNDPEWDDELCFEIMLETGNVVACSQDPVCSEICDSNCDCLDANGDPYSPDTHNYMSYTEEICGDHFSSEQINIVTSHYDDNELEKYLDCSDDFIGDNANWSCAGCMDQTACNYNAGATIEDYSCEFPLEGYNCEGEELSIHGEFIPDKYSLSIYPNPFNPIATISFSISQFRSATITAYDITGRRLETLINTNLNPGNHSLDWNASNYPSGVYFIRMDSGEFTQRQKMVLVK